MNAVPLLLVAATLGVDTGWTELADGGIEYIIQIEPQLLDSLRQGEDLASDIPPAFQGARRYRITVGHGKLPGQGTLPPPQGPKEEPKAANIDPPIGPKPFGAPWAPPAPDKDPDPEPSSLARPNLFPEPNDSKPVGKHAVFNKSEESRPEPSDGEAEKTAPAADPPAAAPQRPWLPLTLTVLILFASIGGNVYLGWIFLGTRGKYRSLLSDTRQGDTQQSDTRQPAAGGEFA